MDTLSANILARRRQREAQQDDPLLRLATSGQGHQSGSSTPLMRPSPPSPPVAPSSPHPVATPLPTDARVATPPPAVRLAMPTAPSTGSTVPVSAVDPRPAPSPPADPVPCVPSPVPAPAETTPMPPVGVLASPPPAPPAPEEPGTSKDSPMAVGAGSPLPSGPPPSEPGPVAGSGGAALTQPASAHVSPEEPAAPVNPFAVPPPPWSPMAQDVPTPEAAKGTQDGPGVEGGQGE